MCILDGNLTISSESLCISQKATKLNKMGCASSKRIEATANAYRPAPTSFAVFDINAIEEPWLKHLNGTTTPLEDQQDKPKRTHVPAPILQKLNMLEATEAPQSWDEVSKALEDLKPVVKPPSTSPPAPTPTPPPPPPSKSVSFHTLEELDAKLTSNARPKPGLKKAAEVYRNKPGPGPGPGPVPAPATADEEGGGIRIKPVKENMFIVRDRLERQKEEKESNYDRMKRDPLSGYPEKCPPGGSDAVVIYTTSLGGVRKTFEECNRARDVLEGHRVVFDERDVSLHCEFLRELKELLGEGEGMALPRVFVKGRYVGGLEELVELNESGRLGRILNATRVERGIGRQACGGCGGARFVPCLDCGGSCKVVVNGSSGVNRERCPKCNENGLVRCPACL